MAFTVQNDNGTQEGANAYVSVDFFKAYHLDRANAYTATDEQIQAAIIKATDYLDTRFPFIGTKAYGRDQTTAWPRVDAFDLDGYSVDGLPEEIKNAVCEYAIRALASSLMADPSRDATGAAIQSKENTVGPITEKITFATGAAYTLPKYPAADRRLIASGLVVSGGSSVRG